MRQARLSRNLSQAELSEKTGITIRSLYSYEQRSMVPRSENARKIAAALGVTVSWLLGEAPSDLSSASQRSNAFFLDSVQEKYGSKGLQEAKELLNRASALFAGGDLDEKSKDAFFQSLMEVYHESKTESSARFAPGARKKRKSE